MLLVLMSRSAAATASDAWYAGLVEQTDVVVERVRRGGTPPGSGIAGVRNYRLHWRKPAPSRVPRGKTLSESECFRAVSRNGGDRCQRSHDSQPTLRRIQRREFLP